MRFICYDKAMSSLSTLGQRQQALLQLLLQNKQGLSVDDIASQLGISRNAVNQHLSSLESNSFIENISMANTGGRPSKLYSLSAQGAGTIPQTLRTVLQPAHALDQTET